VTTVHESERTEIAQLPAIGLTQAIESIRALWRQAEASEVTPQAAAVILGYRRLGPQVQKRLSAFRAYGLIDEGRGVRLSDLALRIMRLELERQQGSRQYLDAVRTAALRPKLFREVFRSHGRAPYDVLLSHLTIDLGLPSMGARTFIAAFRDAIDAGGLRDTESAGLEDDRSTREPHGAPGFAGELRDQRGGNCHLFRWLLSKSAIAELRLIGDEVTAADLDRLGQYIEMARVAFGGDNRSSKQRRSSSRRTSRGRRSGPRRHRR